jgi:hypothetical protein
MESTILSWLVTLGPAFVPTTLLIFMLVLLWRAKVASEKQYREDLKSLVDLHKDEIRTLLLETMSLQREATTAMVTMAEVLRSVDRTLDKMHGRE